MATCPDCASQSWRVHSRYRRRLSDTAITGREVVIRLRVRRLFCDNSDCGRRTFAEQLPGLTARHSRRTAILQRLLCAVALALGGRPGALLWSGKDRAGLADLLGGHGRWPAEALPAGACGGQPLVGALHDEFADELGERGEHVEHEPAARGGGVEGFV
ncbi:transposase family protein [Nocardia sp. KC 131]|uniref:transposase family protein n=1 Tax=Nocardia arseniciresistens TaxID=3392119 RepID=UPI00398EAC6E